MNKLKRIYVYSDIEGGNPFININNVCKKYDNKPSFINNNKLDGLTIINGIITDITYDTGLVYTGDLLDNNVNDIKLLLSLVKIKTNFKDNVILIGGNRDINKIRMRDEFSIINKYNNKNIVYEFFETLRECDTNYDIMNKLINYCEKVVKKFDDEYKFEFNKNYLKKRLKKEGITTWKTLNIDDNFDKLERVQLLYEQTFGTKTAVDNRIYELFELTDNFQNKNISPKIKYVIVALTNTLMGKYNELPKNEKLEKNLFTELNNLYNKYLELIHIISFMSYNNKTYLFSHSVIPRNGKLTYPYGSKYIDTYENSKLFDLLDQINTEFNTSIKNNDTDVLMKYIYLTAVGNKIKINNVEYDTDNANIITRNEEYKDLYYDEIMTGGNNQYDFYNNTGKIIDYVIYGHTPNGPVPSIIQNYNTKYICLDISKIEAITNSPNISFAFLIMDKNSEYIFGTVKFPQKSSGHNYTNNENDDTNPEKILSNKEHIYYVDINNDDKILLRKKDNKTIFKINDQLYYFSMKKFVTTYDKYIAGSKKYNKYLHKYIKYKKINVMSGGKYDNYADLLNNIAPYKDSKVGKTEYMRTVKSCGNQVIPENTRPMYALLKAFGITMNKKKPTDQIFLGLKEKNLMSNNLNLDGQIVVDFSICEKFINGNVDNKTVAFEKNIICELMNSTKHYIEPSSFDKIYIILNKFKNAQINGDYELIYNMSALRLCLLNDPKNEYNKIIYTGVLSNVSRKLTQIKEIVELPQNYYGTDNLLKYANDCIKYFDNKTNLKNILEEKNKQRKIDNQKEIDFINFYNDLDDLKKYTRIGIVVENFINDKIKNISKIKNILENETLDMLSTHICTTQKIIPLLKTKNENDTDNIFYNELMFGTVKKIGNDIKFETNNGDSYFPIILANSSGVDLGTNYRANLYANDMQFIKKTHDNINIIFKNFAKAIDNENIKHFCFIPLGMGVFIEGFDNENLYMKNLLLVEYGNAFYDYFNDKQNLKIYISAYPLKYEFLKQLQSRGTEFFLQNGDEFILTRDSHSQIKNNNIIVGKMGQTEIILHKKDTYLLALELAKNNNNVMLVNPSDCISVLMGEYGYYWNGNGNDYIVGEEILANQTTMCFLYPILRELFNCNDYIIY